HRRTDSYVGAHELGSRPRCWNASLPSRIRACVCYFCYFFDPPFDFPRESPLAHGVALSHRRLAGLALAIGVELELADDNAGRVPEGERKLGYIFVGAFACIYLKTSWKC